MIKTIEMDELTKDNVSKARTNVVMASNLFGYQAYRVKVYATDDPRIQTAAAMVTATENKMFVNPDFWNNVLKSDEERAFVFLHEVEHIFLDHGDRAKSIGYNPMLWNIATDYYNNLVCSGAWGKKGEAPNYNARYAKYLNRPESALFDERFIGMSSDEIYQTLLDEAGGDVEKAINDNLGGAGEEESLLGDVMEGEGTAEEVAVQKAKNIQTAIASVIAAKEGNGIGENEGQFAQMFHDMATPKIYWGDKLNSLITTSVKERQTYNRLSRRTSGGVVFPTYTGKTVNLVYGIDSSGSMSHDDYKRASGELKGIIDQFDTWNINLITCDVVAHEIGVFNSEENDGFVEQGIKIEGGGGTDMSPIAEYASKLFDDGEELNACIILTDGYIPVSSLEESFNPDIINIVVVTEGGNKDLVLEGAEVIHVN